MNGEQVRQWRRDLPKGHRRQPIVTMKRADAPADSVDGQTAQLETEPKTPIKPAMPREVAEDVYGMVWQAVSASRESLQFYAGILRRTKPDVYGSMSDDQIKADIEKHYRQTARAVVEDLYRDKGYDKGNVLGTPVKPA
jgi:hypothetical protein